MQGEEPSWATKTCWTTLSSSHHLEWASSSKGVETAVKTGGTEGLRSGWCGVTGSDKDAIWLKPPRCRIIVRMPSCQAAKSDEPLRMGIWVVVGKERLVLEEEGGKGK